MKRQKSKQGPPEEAEGSEGLTFHFTTVKNNDNNDVTIGESDEEFARRLQVLLFDFHFNFVSSLFDVSTLPFHSL